MSCKAKVFKDPEGVKFRGDGELGKLEAAFINALCAFFPKIKAKNAMADFFATYRKEAEAFDREFTKKHDEDFNTTLIFAGLFSAVTSAFIIDIQTNLQPDYAQETVALLRILIQTGQNSTSQPLPDEWVVDPAIVTVQAVLYASLAASLLAAFLAVLGKQWLNRYMRGRGGSEIERNRDRQIKANGMESWGFSVVMEVLPLMLQAALLLFGCALSSYLWTINIVVAAVNIFFTAAGVIVYTSIVFLATLSYACPYQTPLSSALRYIIKLDKKHYISLITSNIYSLRLQFVTLGKEILVTTNRVIGSIPTVFTPSHLSSDDGAGPVQLAQSYAPWNDPDFTVAWDVSEGEEDQEGLGNLMGPDGEAVLEVRGDELEEQALDAACVSWILQASTDPEVISSAARLVPEISWTGSNRTAIPPLLPLADLSNSCFRDLFGAVTFQAGMERTAFIALKALLHAYTHRCLQGYQDPIPETMVTDWMFSSLYMDDSDDFKLTLDVFHYYSKNRIGNYMWHRTQFTGSDLRFSEPHLFWLCQILLYQIWLCKRRGKYAPKDLFELLEWCCAKRPGLSSPLVNDCIIISGLALGVSFNLQDLSAVDKSREIGRVVPAMLAQMQKMFEKPHSFIQARHAISALKVLISSANLPRLDSWIICNLMHTILESSAVDRLFAARLVLELEVAHGNGWYPDSDLRMSHIDHIIEVLGVHFNLPDDERDGFEQLFVATLQLLLRSSHQGRISLWRENIVSCLCDSLNFGRSSELLQTEILHFLAHNDDYYADDAPESLIQYFSSSVREFWDHIPPNSRSNYHGIFTGVLAKFHRHRWYHYLISDLSKPVDHLQNHDRYDNFPSLILDVSSHMFPSLEDVDDPLITKVWLKLAWRYYRYSSQEHDFFAQVINSTAELFLKGDQSIIAEFDHLALVWVRSRDDRGDFMTISEEHKEVWEGLVDTYLAAAWKFSGLRSRELRNLSHTTAKVYTVKGYDSMDRTVLNSWLKAAWKRDPSDLESEVESATLEILRQGGVTIMNEYRNKLAPSMKGWEMTLAYLKVVEGSVGFDRAMYKELDACQRALDSLEEVWRKVNSDERTINS